jgi:hypothetical protein
MRGRLKGGLGDESHELSVISGLGDKLDGVEGFGT